MTDMLIHTVFIKDNVNKEDVMDALIDKQDNTQLYADKGVCIERDSPHVGENIDHKINQASERNNPNVGENTLNDIKQAIERNSSHIGEHIPNEINQGSERNNPNVGENTLNDIKQTSERNSSHIGEHIPNEINQDSETNSQHLGENILKEINQASQRNSQYVGENTSNEMNQGSERISPHIGENIATKRNHASERNSPHVLEDMLNEIIHVSGRDSPHVCENIPNEIDRDNDRNSSDVGEKIHVEINKDSKRNDLHVGKNTPAEIIIDSERTSSHVCGIDQDKIEWKKCDRTKLKQTEDTDKLNPELLEKKYVSVGGEELMVTEDNSEINNYPNANKLISSNEIKYDDSVVRSCNSGNIEGKCTRNITNKSSELSDEELCVTDESEADRSCSEFDQHLRNTLPNQNTRDDRKDLLKFAEVLYKCTLCTSIPSILTSEESFLRHLNKQHLSKHTHCHECNVCSLKFRTEEDLKEHVIYSHTRNEDSLSCDPIGSDTIGSHDNIIDSNNDSDSDSSGHRQLRARIVKRNKPVQDFESPKQLVDHTGIETLNGSLDLTQKNSDYGNEADKIKSSKVGTDGSKINIKQITDQIIKSDVQGRNVNNDETVKLPFIPSFTTEFGKYTKLVREGGNIVYFCQICNWKSPIKTTFQVHCNMSAHKIKVSSAESPEEVNYDSSSKSPKCTEKNMSPNSNTEKDTEKHKHVGKRAYLAQDNSVRPRMPDQNLLYNYIMRQRGVTQCRGRTPVVSPYGTSNFIEDARFTYKRPNEHPVDLALKKRRRLIKHAKQGHNSDTDSDDDKVCKSYLPQSYCHSSSVMLLRQKLLEGSRSIKQTSSGNNKLNYNDLNFPTDLSVGSDKFESCHGYNHIQESTSVKKEVIDEMDTTDVDLSQTLGYNEIEKHASRNTVDTDMCFLTAGTSVTKHKLSNHSNTNKIEDTLFKLYKCHACSYRYSEVEEYEKHFDRVHKSSARTLLTSPSENPVCRVPVWHQVWADAGSGSRFITDSGLGSDVKGEVSGGRNGEPVISGSCEMGENWRVQKLKEILPDYVIDCERGNTSRDYLLQCVSNSSAIQDAILWSSACNRAMRELFPKSQAQRKGKYKKTYYFGISMLDIYQMSEDLPATEGESPLYQPHRDINIDLEKIVEHIPAILRWTGNMDNGVHRYDLLMVLTDVIHDTDVTNWGAQCNRALRLVFPNVDMKRKGKYKTTMYLGVQFQEQVLVKKLSTYNCMDTTLGEFKGKSPVSVEINSKDLKRERTVEQLHRERSNSFNSVLWNGVNGSNTPASTYPQWMRRQAQNEISHYLSKFGGLSMFETKTGLPEGAGLGDVELAGGAGHCDAGSPEGAGLRDAVSLGVAGHSGDVTVDQTDDNDGDDGDDEEESLDSIQTQ